ncbi:MAG TPA: metallophosphoesterase family protein [Ktedonobacteraceae bacterium]|nr:metallophosphoesterase family protein [Ktedonobacteraceae bacterium]
MRYAIFSDIHANLEALEAVLAKIDELAQEEPIEQIWFLGDLVGYGPDPNECILKLRERTDVIIAGNHDWAAVGKIDLEDFSAAARISAEWTAEHLTEEHRIFLTNLPERLEFDECTLVHGSPYGPLWEYLTSEVLAERSFQYFSSRYCLVGHTHIPIIFQQPDEFSNAPTLPLNSDEPTKVLQKPNGIEHRRDEGDDETEEIVVVQSPAQQSTLSSTVNGTVDSAFKEPESVNEVEIEEGVRLPAEMKLMQTSNDKHIHAEDAIKVVDYLDTTIDGLISSGGEEIVSAAFDDPQTKEAVMTEEHSALLANTAMESEKEDIVPSERNDTGNDGNIDPVQVEDGVMPESENARSNEVEDSESKTAHNEDTHEQIISTTSKDFDQDGVDHVSTEEAGSQNSIDSVDEEQPDLEISLEPVAAASDDQLSGEIEELLSLLGLSQSMIQVTNEMITPPEGRWEAGDGYRAIINPGGVGQPRDGDPRAAFLIYDTERGFEFYRVPYAFEKTQEKIIKAGLPQYLAVRLEYGR